MPECTSTSSSRTARAAIGATVGAVAAGLLLMASMAHAEDPLGPTGGAKSMPSRDAAQPQEEDFSQTPYTEYGEFDEHADETATTQFFQYGRFFGVSLGAGMHGVTGNRGIVWNTGVPLLWVQLHYWFDFNLALQMGFFTVSHSWLKGSETVDANVTHVGIDVKYYFDTRNMPAPISFAGPHLVAGFGSFTKSENFPDESISDRITAFGVGGGAGLEFTVVPRKAYFGVEGKYLFVPYSDRGRSTYATTNGAPDLTGGFYTVVGKLLFTW